MKQAFSFLSKIAVLGMTLFFVSAHLKMSEKNISCLWDSASCFSKSIHDNYISHYVKRFDEIKKYIPPHAVTGYLGDAENLSPDDRTFHYYLAQYALAPRIVVRSDTFPAVVANIVAEQNPVSNIDTSVWNILYNSGNGLFLIKKK